MNVSVKPGPKYSVADPKFYDLLSGAGIAIAGLAAAAVFLDSYDVVLRDPDGQIFSFAAIVDLIW